MDTKDKFGAQIRLSIGRWTRNYMSYIKFIDQKEGELNYVCIFSKPTQKIPIPQFVVKVYFQVTVKESGEPGIIFRFEQNKLIHTLDNTVNNEQMESFIDSFY